MSTAYKMLVNGQWVEAKSGKSFAVTNPATEESLGTVPEAGPEDLDLAVKAARAALDGAWGKMSAADRGKLIWKAGELMLARLDDLSKLETANQGKPIFESSKIDVPWNFPILLATWKLAPALAAGCTMVLKPASNTPITALKLGEIFTDAGFPPGVVNVITGPGARTGAAMAAHPGIDKISFTGSTAVGRWIGEVCSDYAGGFPVPATQYLDVADESAKDGIPRPAPIRGRRRKEDLRQSSPEDRSLLE